MSQLSRRVFLGACGAFMALPAIAQSNLDALAGLLIDIPGWEGERPDTMSGNHGGLNVAYAVRKYEQGDKEFLAMLGRSGLERQAQMPTGAGQGDTSFTSGNMAMTTRTVSGFRVFTAYDKEDKGGMILVFLGGNATFSLQFDEMTVDAALALAQRFDWTAMQRAAAR